MEPGYAEGDPMVVSVLMSPAFGLLLMSLWSKKTNCRRH